MIIILQENCFLKKFALHLQTGDNCLELFFAPLCRLR